MRQKRESVLSVRWNDEGLPLPVRVYRAKYQAISQVLDRSPEILACKLHFANCRAVVSVR
jgi:hypothetical protein